MPKQDPALLTRLLQDAPPQLERNLPAILDRQARALGQQVFATVQGRPITFVECRDGAARFAGTLAASGIRAGDRVAIMCGNRIEFLTAFLGTIWIGAIAVPLNTALRGGQLDHVLANSGARLLIVDGELTESLARLTAPGLEKVWLLDPPAGELRGNWESGPVPPLPPLAEAMPLRAFAPSDTCAILYTSGTTGPSKGVIYPADQLYWWAAGMNVQMKVGADSVLFTTLPLFHINALAASLQSLISGAPCVIRARFSASRFWAEAIEARATHTYLVGSMGSILLAQPPGPLDQAHGIRTTFGSSVRSSVWAEFSPRFNVPRRVGGYGSTETNAVFLTESGWEVQGNMGRPLPGYQAAVVDEFDAPVPDGQPGEMVLRADIPFAFATGYWGMPEATISAWRNLWFHTGDLVVRNSEGVFRFVGRLKESIRRRGENISSWEVEQAILSHDGVSDAAAFGVPSSIGDEDVMAIVILREGRRVEPEDLLRHLDDRLAYFAIPRYIEFMTELPLTENGKIKRLELKQRGVTAATWDRESVGYKVARDKLKKSG